MQEKLEKKLRVHNNLGHITIHCGYRNTPIIVDTENQLSFISLSVMSRQAHVLFFMCWLWFAFLLIVG